MQRVPRYKEYYIQIMGSYCVSSDEIVNYKYSVDRALNLGVMGLALYPMINHRGCIPIEAKLSILKTYISTVTLETTQTGSKHCIKVNN